eukprot:7337426-Lingulodinium_polyedra.AAC.1
MRCCRQKDLSACRRFLPSAPTVRSTPQAYLTIVLLSECDGSFAKQRVCSELMVVWSARELRLLIARLRGLGFMVAVAPRPRGRDLVAAITRTKERAPREPA